MIKFTKLCAGGNDFIVVDNRRRSISSGKAGLARNLCQRRFSVGADGLILLEKSSQSNDFRMRIFNPDGSEAEMCGNGARCLACFARTKGVVNDDHLTFDTLAGKMEAYVHGDEVRLKMSDPTGIRMRLSLSLENGKVYEVHYLDTGVPHAVLEVDDLDNVPVNELGKEIRCHQEFSSRGTNVDFIKVMDKNSLKIRTYERGVEQETLACGTGSVAAAIVAYSLGKVVEQPVEVHTQGKEILKVYFDKLSSRVSNVYLEGNVKFVYEGEIPWEG